MHFGAAQRSWEGAGRHEPGRSAIRSGAKIILVARASLLQKPFRAVLVGLIAEHRLILKLASAYLFMLSASAFSSIVRLRAISLTHLPSASSS